MSDNRQYIIMTMNAKNAIVATIGSLKKTQNNCDDEEKKEEIDIEIRKLNAELARITAEENAHIAHGKKINPPSESDVKDIKTMSERLDEMIANAQASKDIVNTVTEIIETWNKTQGG